MPFDLDDTWQPPEQAAAEPVQAKPRHGGWVPLWKGLSRYFPTGRPYTELEAVFSLALDYDAGNTVTVAGYAALWGWSRGKVARFLDRAGIAIAYPDTTVERQNQRGQIMIQIPDRKRADNGQIMFIDYKELRAGANRKRADNGQKTSRSRSTTTEPEPKPKYITAADGVEWTVDDLFLVMWEAYPRKEKKAAALKAFRATVKTAADAAQFKSALYQYLDHIVTAGKEYQHIKQGVTFFKEWQEWIPSGSTPAPLPPKPDDKLAEARRRAIESENLRAASMEV